MDNVETENYDISSFDEEEPTITLLDKPVIIGSFKVIADNDDIEEITFKEPIHFVVHNFHYESDNSDVLFVEYEPLGIITYGEDWDDLCQTLEEELSVIWDWIVVCDDCQLTLNAQQVKRNFLNMVERQSGVP